MAWDEIKQRRGVVTKVATALGITTAAVSQWRDVPEARREAVAAALGVHLNDLRSVPTPVTQDAA